MSDMVARNQQTGIVNAEDDNPFLAYGRAAARTRIVGQLLKFNKFGDWTAGESNEEMPEHTQMTVHMDEFYIGWIRWEDNKPVEQVMGRVKDNFQPPRRIDLGDNDKENWPIDASGNQRDPWQFSNYIVMMEVGSQQLYTFATASRGGLQAIGKLSEVYGRSIRHRPDEFPVVRLGCGEYRHPNKAFGMIKFPTLEIDGWQNRQAIDQVLENRAEGEDAEADARVEPRSLENAKPDLRQNQKPPKNDYAAATGRSSPRPEPRSVSSDKLPKARF